MANGLLDVANAVEILEVANVKVLCTVAARNGGLNENGFGEAIISHEKVVLALSRACCKEVINCIKQSIAIRGILNIKGKKGGRGAIATAS